MDNAGQAFIDLLRSKEQKAFHLTCTKNVKSIMQQGLRSTRGPRVKELDDAEGVYLFPTMDALEDAEWLLDSLPEDEPLAVIEVTLPQGSALSSDVGFELRSAEDIPPSQLRVVSTDF